MSKIKLILILSFSISAGNLYAQNFDFAVNLGNFGWGVNVPQDSNRGHMTFTFFNFYVEHINSGVGIEFSPLNITSYSSSNFVTSYFNLRLYYNLLGFVLDYDMRRGSNYLLFGPFISINYLNFENNNAFDPNAMQINIGIKVFGMIDYSKIWRGNIFPPLGFQFLNIELGYRYNNFRINNHQFYFNITTDIIILGYIIGVIAYNSISRQ